MAGTRRTNQGGSVATFVVVGLILVVTLVGAIYLVKIRSQQARNNQEIATSETKKPASTNNSTSNGSTKSSESSQSSDTSDSQAENTAASTTTSQGLPTTGPGIDILQLVGVYMLAVSSTAYILSRRKLARSL
jgi:cytoskeletal protein RodZ